MRDGVGWIPFGIGQRPLPGVLRVCFCDHLQREPTLNLCRRCGWTMIAEPHRRGPRGPRGLLPKWGWSRPSLVWCGGLFHPPSTNPRPAGFYFLPYRKLASTSVLASCIHPSLLTGPAYLIPMVIRSQWSIYVPEVQTEFAYLSPLVTHLLVLYPPPSGWAPGFSPRVWRGDNFTTNTLFDNHLLPCG